MIGFETTRRALVMILVLACAANITRANEQVIDDLVVTVIEQTQVSANQDGVLSELMVCEGDAVTRGQVLGKLDDREARLNESLARTQLAIATARAQHQWPVELAEKSLAQQRQIAKQQEFTQAIANHKAENDFAIRASEKAEGVTENELLRATQARQAFTGSVSKSEIDGLRLAFQRSQLETKQAQFERQINELTAQSEGQSAIAHQLGIERAEVQREQAIAAQVSAKLEAEMQSQHVKLAALSVDRHRLTSPIDGVVVERSRQPGEWVQAGTPVLRIVYLKRLRAEGYADLPIADRLRQHPNVRLVVACERASAKNLPATVTFISPEVDPINQQVKFFVEFENIDSLILPGMHAKLELPIP